MEGVGDCLQRRRIKLNAYGDAGVHVAAVAGVAVRVERKFFCWPKALEILFHYEMRHVQV